MSDGNRKIDFVLVYEKLTKNNEQENKKRQFFERNLENNGLQLEIDEIEDDGKQLTFVKVHAPWYTLCPVAENLKIKLPLWLNDGPMLRKQSQLRIYLKKLFECNILMKSKGLTREKREKNSITWPFSVRNKDRYAVKDRRTFFSTAQRIEIVWEVLQKTRNDLNNERKRGLAELLSRKIYTAAFPLHEGDAFRTKNGFVKNTPRKQLLSTWASWSQILRPQPLRKIQKYFGHKIGFYFAFMDFYLKMLVFPAIAGAMVIFYGLFVYNEEHKELRDICDPNNAPGNYTMCPICEPPNCDPWLMAAEGCSKYKIEFRLDNEAVLFMSCFTIAWAILFLKLWKRREARLAADWDSIDVKVRNAAIRPDYENTAPTVRKNWVTSQMEPHWPFWQRMARIFASILATFVVLCLAELSLFSLLISRVALYGAFKRAGGELAEYNTFAARFLINKFVFVSVILFESIYTKLSFSLTNFERPKTNFDFMNSLLWKLFIFKIINAFLPIVYSAWIKGKTVKTPADLNYFKELCDGGCLGEVVELIAILLVARFIIENILEILVPFIKNFIKRYKHSSFEEHRKLPRWLKDYHMCEVILDGVYKEYMEMMLQFAFLIFCVTVFPATPFICFINNIFEIRIDANKLLKGNRRPLPERVRGIKIWFHFLDVIVKVGIVFNAALIAFTSESLPRIFYSYERNNNAGIVGYTEYSLSSINVSAYDKHSREYLRSKNVTTCWYAGFRQSSPPYWFRFDYHRILTIKLSAFATYIVVFCAFMWIVNSLIDDVPPDVKIRMQRRKHIVMKSLEEEGALKKRNVRRKYGTNKYKISLPETLDSFTDNTFNL